MVKPPRSPAGLAPGASAGPNPRQFHSLCCHPVAGFNFEPLQQTQSQPLPFLLCSSLSVSGGAAQEGNKRQQPLPYPDRKTLGTTCCCFPSLLSLPKSHLNAQDHQESASGGQESSLQNPFVTEREY